MLHRSLACAALVIGVAGDALAQARPGHADITIDATSADTAHVEARYVLAPLPSPIELKVLTRPCVTITNLQMQRDGGAWIVSPSRKGPWMTYRDTIPSRGDSIRLFVRYDVRLSGTGIIPLVHPTSAFASGVPARLGTVSVAVRFADDAGRVAFPHMTRQAARAWSARYVAVPSFVEIASAGPTRCEEGPPERSDNGGLVWRFFLLVGIMIAWVPLYLAWARRSIDPGRT